MGRTPRGARPGDRLLLCGRHHVRDRMDWTLQNEHALSYILTGQARPQGWVWRRLVRKGTNGGVAADH